MDSGNSGSISSSDEEYDSSSHADPSSSLILNHFSSISHPQQPSLVPSMFDLSSTYLHPLSHPNSNFLNLDSHQGPRSAPNCTLPQSLPSSSSSTPTPNQYFSGHDNIIINTTTTQFSSSPQTQTQTNNSNVVVRNSKKRSRASRRAPTTVLTTDTTNFRSMVQEFTGIPAPPFSPSFSRRIPLRPTPLLSSSSSRTTLLHNTTTINVFSPNNNNNNNSINYQLLPDLSLPYHPNNNNLMQQNHPIPSFHPSPSSLHSLIPQGFGKSSPNMLPLDDHAHVMGAHGHEHVINSEGMLLRSVGDEERSRDPFNDSYGGGCKLNMSVSASSSLNHEKNMENGNSARDGGGAVEAWICSSDQ